MTAYSKAAKRRAKKAKMAGLPGLAPSKKRDRSGCFVERTRQQQDDPKPRKVVLEARCRILNLNATPDNLALVDNVMLSDPCGVAVYLKASRDARDRLWKVFSDLDRAEEIYHRRILGVSRHAKCGKIEFFPERFSSENAPAADPRDDETKDRDAVNVWMHWRGLVGKLPSEQQSAIFDGMYCRKVLHTDGEITRHGKSFFEALKNLVALT